MMEILDYTKKNPNKVKINITPGFSNEFTVKKVERATGAQFIKVPSPKVERMLALPS